MAHATRFNGAAVPTYRENQNRSKAVLPAMGSSTTPPSSLQGHHRATGHRLHHYAGTAMTSASVDRMVEKHLPRIYGYTEVIYDLTMVSELSCQCVTLTLTR